MAKSERIIEAYVGEYASGKSEVAVNRALMLFQQGQIPVTLVDFDLVEPFYTLRPLKRKLEEKGIKVLAWETLKTMGFGETGTLLKPEVRWALKRAGNIVIDVGYGVAGAQKLRLLEASGEGEHSSLNENDKKNKMNRNDNEIMRKELKVYVVINIARPMTEDVAGIVNYVKSLGPFVQGLINNSHWGEETNLGIIQKGAEVVTEAAKILELPVIWTTAEKRFAAQIGQADLMGNPVFFLERYMKWAFW